jgi:oxygen-independent coproporphyrinogen-3 oxidase
VETAADYIARSERGESPRAEESRPDPVEEKFFVGLRLAEGVAADDADWARFGSVFERGLADGMIETTGQRLRLTPRGIMVSNEIFQEFIGT